MKRRTLASTAGLTLLALFTLPAHAQGPTLVPAALTSMAPPGVRRGQTVTLTLFGINIGSATKVVFDDPAITGTVAPGGNANTAKVSAMLGESTRLGLHSLS